MEKNNKFLYIQGDPNDITSGSNIIVDLNNMIFLRKSGTSLEFGYPMANSSGQIAHYTHNFNDANLCRTMYEKIINRLEELTYFVVVN